ncbi:uncharacterized protein LOC130295604 isoform X2 [Hyla sarda]|uniref:uncharacterized protein LOC130295604 isoform X2 n=1 Tax=Hyla sarda TaxID=327740 RepID=UPI0024C365C2|nr:uncharacterized protein LOC130295604 isoform X2 [Hyla sarda]
MPGQLTSGSSLPRPVFPNQGGSSCCKTTTPSMAGQSTSGSSLPRPVLPNQGASSCFKTTTPSMPGQLTSGGPQFEDQCLGRCPPYVHGVHCLSRMDPGCSSDSECGWNEMCCFNGCTKMCMKIIRDKPNIPFHIPKPQPKPLPFWPELPPTNPDDPFPIYPPLPDPIPNRPLPPILFPPMDPANYYPDDDHLPAFPGGGGGGGGEFNFP